MNNSTSEGNLEELLKKLKKKAGEDAVNFAHITEYDEWVCVCGTVNLLDKKQKIQNCSKCHRNRDFALKNYAHPSLKKRKTFKKDTTTQTKTLGLSIWSLVLGILGLPLGFLVGIPAIICGHFARYRIKNSPSELSGNGLALAGIITGYISIVWPIALLIVFSYFGVPLIRVLILRSFLAPFLGR